MNNTDLEKKIEEILDKYSDFIGNTGDPMKDLGMGKITLAGEISTLCAERERQLLSKIYRMGLVYEAQVADMSLGEEESALLLDDFVKDISELLATHQKSVEEKRENK